MKRVIDTSEVLGLADSPDGPCDVCAAAEARYDEQSSQLTVTLTAFLRTADIRRKEWRLTADWLPKPETIIETVGPDETAAAAREVFRCWTRRVREAMPVAAHR